MCESMSAFVCVCVYEPPGPVLGDGLLQGAGASSLILLWLLLPCSPSPPGGMWGSDWREPGPSRE